MIRENYLNPNRAVSRVYVKTVKRSFSFPYKEFDKDSIHDRLELVEYMKENFPYWVVDTNGFLLDIISIDVKKGGE